MSNSVTPWTIARQSPLSIGFSSQEYWGGLPFPLGDLPESRLKPMFPALAGDSLSLATNQFSTVAQSCLTLCDPWTAAHQASLSITNSQGLLKLMSIESLMPSTHPILCHKIGIIFDSMRD